MIEIKNVTKNFGTTRALNNVNLTIESGKIYGLLGSNGAGKSTLLRIIADILETDSGEVIVNGKDVRNNEKTKRQIFFLADEPYFYPNCTLENLAKFYKNFYPEFSMEIYTRLCDILKLEKTKNISKFSKGMKRQSMMIMALASNVKYIIFDEIFDGVDVNTRRLIKRIIPDLIEKNNTTIIISTHNLAEIDNFADELSLFIKGEVVYTSSLDHMKESTVKYQLAFADEKQQKDFDDAGLDILMFKKDGKFIKLIANGDIEETEQKLNKMNPLLVEARPITIDELFMMYMEKSGYSLDGIEFSFEEEINKEGEAQWEQIN